MFALIDCNNFYASCERVFNPKLIGKPLAILSNNEVISKVRGKWHEIKINELKIQTMVSFHPAYLLRQPDQKKFSWIDLKIIRDKLKNSK